jgi:ABC-2 type transport system permease protein
MLVATFRRGEIVLGYVLGFAGLAFVQAVLVLATIALLYDVPRLAARLPLVLVVVFLLALASIGLGLLVSSTARSEGQIFPFISAVIVPSLLLSGLLIPFDELSFPLQASRVSCLLRTRRTSWCRCSARGSQSLTNLVIWSGWGVTRQRWSPSPA